MRYLFLFVSLLGCLSVNADELKIGVVDPRAVVAEAPQRDAIVKTLESEFRGRAEEIQKLGEQIQGLLDKAKKDGPIMTAEEKTELKRKVEGLEVDFRLKERAFKEDTQRREREERQKLIVEIKEAVAVVAKENNYDIILSSETVPYISDRADITEKVIEHIKK